MWTRHPLELPTDDALVEDGRLPCRWKYCGYQTRPGIQYCCYRTRLGTNGATKTDEFSEKFQTAFDPPPPPSFSENHIADFATKVRMFIMVGLL